MKTSLDRILTTHTGSLPRPPSLTNRHDGQAVRDTVQQSATKQLAAGVDIINDGEMSKASFATYVIERISGFGGPPIPVPRWGYEDFPEYARKHRESPRGQRSHRDRVVHVGSVARRDRHVHAERLLPEH